MAYESMFYSIYIYTLEQYLPLSCSLVWFVSGCYGLFGVGGDWSASLGGEVAVAGVVQVVGVAGVV